MKREARREAQRKAKEAAWRERRRFPRPDWCVYWRGVMEKECGIGVRMRTVADWGPDRLQPAKYPCGPDPTDRSRWDCPLRVTRQELEGESRSP